MEFKKEKLANGLDVIGEINQSAKSTAVGFFVKTGSRDETEQINGVSHFLEHMLFKGTEKMSAAEVNEAFDKTGAQFNAFTTEENTVFYAAVLPEYLIEVSQLWAHLMRPALRNDDFNIEKNVIKEEIAMYMDLPNFDVMEKCRNLHFGDSPCGFSVLGTEKSIDNLTARQMHDYFSNRYAPNNMILACTGNLDWDRFCSIAAESCSQWQKQDVKRTLQNTDGSRKKERTSKPNLVREHICLMSDAVSFQDPARYAAGILGTIIGDDVGSRFFWELVDVALAEAASMQFSPMDGTGVFYSYIRCSSDNVEQVLDIVRNIFNNISKEGITQNELEKAKNKILSELVIKNELPMGRLVDLGFNWVYLKKYHTIEEQVDAIKAVTVKDINSLIELYNPINFTQFSIGPERNG